MRLPPAHGQGTVPRLQPPFWKWLCHQEGRYYLKIGTPPVFVLSFSKQPTLVLAHELWRLVALFPRQEASCRLLSRHTRLSGASAWRLPHACTQTLGNPFVFRQQRACGRKDRFSGACRVTFLTWHSLHAVLHMKGHAALPRLGKVTVQGRSLCERKLRALHLTPRDNTAEGPSFTPV